MKWKHGDLRINKLHSAQDEFRCFIKWLKATIVVFKGFSFQNVMDFGVLSTICTSLSHFLQKVSCLIKGVNFLHFLPITSIELFGSLFESTSLVNTTYLSTNLKKNNMDVTFAASFKPKIDFKWWEIDILANLSNSMTRKLTPKSTNGDWEQATWVNIKQSAFFMEASHGYLDIHELMNLVGEILHFFNF